MNIENLFIKDITREIQGVIKIGQKEEDTIRLELEEYVVTEELQKHLDTFFKAYTRSIEQPTDKVGTWISGFFGSGKSHFLKILSYLLDSSIIIDGKKPVEFFEGKIKKQELLNQMREVSVIPSEVILFNIDSKSETDGKQNKMAIVQVLNKVFNEMRGYSASIPWLAQLEGILDKNRQYIAFQEYFKEETDLDWIEGREELFFNQDEMIVALTKATGMSEESARIWIENGEDNYSISVDSFAHRLKDYLETKEDNYHLVFAIDEVGQFISEDVQLMLNLQTVVEDLGKLLNGKVWVMVTSQQDIDSLTENMAVTDFSKIQGRFNTRINLSSANADEVIKIRLLEKTKPAQDTLLLTFDEQEAALKNKLEFENSATMRFYKDRNDFSDVYPFIPYQFNLLQKVFTSIREHGSAGKHLSDGERNLLESIQQATLKFKQDEIGKLIPFQTFYESIEQALEHSVRSTIIKADQNDGLSMFDIEVLKLLFLIRHIEELPGTLKNLTTLMLSEIREDTIDLSKKISESLLRLQKEFLIQRIGDRYLFLTNEEQDVNREISRIQIPTSELVVEAGKVFYDEMINLKKYIFFPFDGKTVPQYLFDFSQWIDERVIRNGHLDFGIKIISVYSELSEETEIISLSQREGTRVIVCLPKDEDFSDLRHYLKINQYLRSQSTKTKTPEIQEINARKANERNQIQSIIRLKFQVAIEQADIYVNGYLIEKSGSLTKRIEEGLRAAVDATYPKISYMKVSYAKENLDKLIQDSELQLLDSHYADENSLATQEIENYLTILNQRKVTVTIREILQRYQSSPYGWREWDIMGSLIILLKDEKLNFMLNSRKLDMQEIDFLKTLLKKDTQEKIILSKREVLSVQSSNTAKMLMRELFGIHTIGDKEEEMFRSVSARFSKEELLLGKLIAEYRYANFPEKEIVEATVKLIHKVIIIEESTDFFNCLFENEQAIIANFEALQDIKAFFDTNQKDIFIRAKKSLELYHQDKNYLNNSDIDFVMETVEEILKMSKPYKRIKELPELIERFNLELTQQLEGISQPIRDIIEQDRSDIMKEIVGWQEFHEIERIRGAFEFKMNDLEKKK